MIQLSENWVRREKVPWRLLFRSESAAESAGSFMESFLSFNHHWVLKRPGTLEEQE